MLHKENSIKMQMKTKWEIFPYIFRPELVYSRKTLFFSFDGVFHQI